MKNHPHWRLGKEHHYISLNVPEFVLKVGSPFLIVSLTAFAVISDGLVR
ncbi:hypothetical protein M3226_26300 [Neobacillus cucumis]|nr:hypothetical protein [Neobacillus cucumis]MCM3729128.1 hypothetical protein [Neobacillus cucumis]